MEKKKEMCSERIKTGDVLLNGKKNFEIKKWQKPTLDDVSEKIMAQPYIRFT